MIVKNESKIIERLLDSVKEIIDCVSICDTGSDDNTVDIIKRYLKKHKIPGKVYRHEWKNFGHNRTLSAKMAQQTIRELGFSLSDTYLLLLDADMVLNILPQFNKKNLTEQGYIVLQKSDVLTYWNTRLVQASLTWEAVGVTHEYWASKEPSKKQILHTLLIDDREDGGCKADKVKRDIALLVEGLKEEPKNLRYMFYLAQTYESAKNFPLALEYFEKRISGGGWDEEIFESLLQIALIYEQLGKPFEIVEEAYKRAFFSRPNRSEPLFLLAKYYRNHYRFDLAYEIAKIGVTIPLPQMDRLFVRPFVYEWGMKFEFCMAAYGNNRFNECQQLSSELLQNRNLPMDIHAAVIQNLSAVNLKLVQNLGNAGPSIKIDS